MRRLAPRPAPVRPRTGLALALLGALAVAGAGCAIGITDRATGTETEPAHPVYAPTRPAPPAGPPEALPAVPVPAAPAAATPAPGEAEEDTRRYAVEVARSPDEQTAREGARGLADRGFPSYVLREGPPARPTYHIRVGPFGDQGSAQAIAAALGGLGYSTAIVVEP